MMCHMTDERGHLVRPPGASEVAARGGGVGGRRRRRRGKANQWRRNEPRTETMAYNPRKTKQNKQSKTKQNKQNYTTLN